MIRSSQVESGIRGWDPHQYPFILDKIKFWKKLGLVEIWLKVEYNFL
jgi:hypothetical protein